MKFLPLIWAALGRRKLRTAYTMASVMVAFLLYGLLVAVQAAFGAGVKLQGSDRLVTHGRYSISQLLPYGYWQRIRNVPGVQEVTFASWFAGIYQSERNFFPQLAVDARTYLDIYPEIVLPKDQKQAFLNTRTGAVVARPLADRFGWKVGDRIPMQSTLWPLKDGGNVWTFDLTGIFDTRTPEERRQFEIMLFHHDYFDEARQFANGTVGWFIPKVKDPAQAPQVAEAIDALFKNSPNETRTETEKAFNQAFLKQLGDLGVIMASILGMVFLELLLLTGNTMMQSVRERVPELAVLKTLGFSDRAVMWLVLAESALLCLGAAVAGMLAAAPILSFIARRIAARLPGFTDLALGANTWAGALAMALALALVVGAVPARRAMKLDIVNALAGH